MAGSVASSLVHPETFLFCTVLAHRIVGRVYRGFRMEQASPPVGYSAIRPFLSLPYGRQSRHVTYRIAYRMVGVGAHPCIRTLPFFILQIDPWAV